MMSNFSPFGLFVPLYFLSIIVLFVIGIYLMIRIIQFLNHRTEHDRALLARFDRFLAIYEKNQEKNER